MGVEGGGRWYLTFFQRYYKLSECSCSISSSTNIFNNKYNAVFSRQQTYPFGIHHYNKNNPFGTKYFNKQPIRDISQQQTNFLRQRESTTTNIFTYIRNLPSHSRFPLLESMHPNSPRHRVTKIQNPNLVLVGGRTCEQFSTFRVTVSHHCIFMWCRLEQLSWEFTWKSYHECYTHWENLSTL